MFCLTSIYIFTCWPAGIFFIFLLCLLDALLAVEVKCFTAGATFFVLPYTEPAAIRFLRPDGTHSSCELTKDATSNVWHYTSTPGTELPYGPVAGSDCDFPVAQPSGDDVSL